MVYRFRTRASVATVDPGVYNIGKFSQKITTTYSQWSFFCYSNMIYFSISVVTVFYALTSCIETYDDTLAVLLFQTYLTSDYNTQNKKGSYVKTLHISF